MWTTNEVITILVAGYGAIIATLSFILSIVLGVNELKKNKANMKVSISGGSLVDSDYSQSESMIIVTGLNRGQTKIIITGCGWLTDDNHKYQILKPLMLSFPYVVDPHRKIEAYFACRWFQNLAYKDKIVGYFFQDDEGNMWKANISKKQKEGWKKSISSGYHIEWNEHLQEYYRAK